MSADKEYQQLVRMQEVEVKIRELEKSANSLWSFVYFQYIALVLTILALVWVANS